MADDPDHAGPDQAGLIELIAGATADPPVGLVIVGWERPTSNPDDDHQVERGVAFAVAASVGPSTLVRASADAEMALVQPALSGPATAEALAHRVARELDLELDRLAIAADQTAARWAIGVAVGRSDDGPVDLLRYARAALDDAWLLGGRRLVAFDDGDRELLDRPTDPE